MTAGVLYVVATPMGNLQDISLRALETLKNVSLIAAEDTRHSQRLLQHYQITTQVSSLHQHNERQRCQGLIERLQQGQSIALISDAGTPLISDPGYLLVAEVRAQGLPVVPIPGACALITALSASGLDTQAFSFLGFLPAKAGARLRQLQALQEESRTLIFYEAPHRILESLQAMLEVFGPQRQVCLARELTKTFETLLTLPLEQLLAQVASDPNQRKGEMVLLVAGAEPSEGLSLEARQLLAALMEALPLKQAAQITAQHYGLKPKPLYQYGLQLQGKSSG